MFDAVPAERAERTASIRAVRPDTDYREYVDGKPRADGVRAFLASRGIELPEGDAGRPARRGDRARPGQPEERACCSRASTRRGQGVRGLAALSGRGPRRRAAPGGGVLQRQHRGRCSRSPAWTEFVEAGRRHHDRASEHLRASRRRTRSCAGGRAARGRAGQAAVFEDATRRGRGRARRRLRLRGRASTGSVTPTSCASTAPTSWSPTWPNC